MKIDQVFKYKTPVHILREFFDVHKNQIFTSHEITDALRDQNLANPQGISGYLSRFPSLLISKSRRVYGHKQAIAKLQKDAARIDDMRPSRYWVDQIFLKYTNEVFRPIEIVERIREDFNRCVSIYVLRSVLSDHTSVCIGHERAKGFYGSPKALKKLMNELEKRETHYTVVQRGG